MKSIDANSDSVTAQLGFPAFVDVAGHNSVAELFGRLKSRCGLYLLRFADGILYIGRAVDAVRRFA